MAKKGFKLIKNVKPNITGPKLRGEGSAEVQPKAQVGPVYFKLSLIAVPPNRSGFPDFGPDPDFFGKIGQTCKGFIKDDRHLTSASN